MNNYISISEASAIMGITTTTLRRWESSGKLVANYRTFRNHRRYCLNDILELTNEKKKQIIKKTICYSR
jgi:DNA-binding transcriptional MerR regulator